MATHNISSRTPGCRWDNFNQEFSGVIPAGKFATGDILRFPDFNSSNIIGGSIVFESATPVSMTLVRPDLSTPITVTANNSGTSPVIRFFFRKGARRGGSGASVLRFQVNFGS